MRFLKSRPGRFPPAGHPIPNAGRPPHEPQPSHRQERRQGDLTVVVEPQRDPVQGEEREEQAAEEQEKRARESEKLPHQICRRLSLTQAAQPRISSPRLR